MQKSLEKFQAERNGSRRNFVKFEEMNEKMPLPTKKQVEDEFGKDFNPENFTVERTGHYKFLIHIPSGCPVGVRRCMECPKNNLCGWINK